MADDHASALDDIFSFDGGEAPAVAATPGVRLPQLDLMQGDDASAFDIVGEGDNDPLLADVFDAFGSPAPVKSQPATSTSSGGGAGGDADMDDLLSSMEALLGPSSPGKGGSPGAAHRKASLTLESSPSHTSPLKPVEAAEEKGETVVAVATAAAAPEAAAAVIEEAKAPAAPVAPVSMEAEEVAPAQVQPAATDSNSAAAPVEAEATAIAAEAEAEAPAPAAAAAEGEAVVDAAPEATEPVADASHVSVEEELAREAGDVAHGEGEASEAAPPVATMPLVAPIIRYVAPHEALPSGLSAASSAFYSQPSSGSDAASFWAEQVASAAAKDATRLAADDELVAFCVKAAHIHPSLRARAWVAATQRAASMYELERPEMGLFLGEGDAGAAVAALLAAVVETLEGEDEDEDAWGAVYGAAAASGDDGAEGAAVLPKPAALRVAAAFCVRRGFTADSPPSAAYLAHLKRVLAPVLFIQAAPAAAAADAEAAAPSPALPEALALQLLEGVAATLFPTLLMHPDAWAPADAPPLSHSSWRRLSESTRLLLQYHAPALACALNDACPGWHRLVAPAAVKPAAAPKPAGDADAAAASAGAPGSAAEPEEQPGCLPLAWFAHGFVTPGCSPALVLPLWDRLLLASFTLHDRDAKRVDASPDAEVGADLMSWPKSGAGGLAFGLASLVVAALKAEAPRLMMLCPTSGPSGATAADEDVAGSEGGGEARPSRRRAAAAASAGASYLVRLTLQGVVKRLLAPASAGCSTLDAVAGWVADATTLARNVPTLFAASVAAAIPTSRAAALRVPSAETAAQLVFGWARVSGAYVTTAGAKASGPGKGCPVLWPGLGTDAEAAAAAAGSQEGSGLAVAPPPVTGPPVRYLLVDVRPVLHRRAGRIAVAFHIDPASCAVGTEEDEEEEQAAAREEQAPAEAAAPAATVAAGDAAGEASTGPAAAGETPAPAAAALLFSPGTIEAAGTGSSRQRRASTAGQAAVAAFDAGVDDAVKAAPFSPGSPGPAPAPPAAAPAEAPAADSAEGGPATEAPAAEAPPTLETSVEPPATPTKPHSAAAPGVHPRAPPAASPATAQGLPLADAVDQLREIVAQSEDVHVLVVGVGVRLIASAYEPQLLDACAKQDEERVKTVVQALVRAGVPRVSIAQGGYAELHRLVRTRSVPPPLGLSALFPSLACPRPDATAPSPSSALGMLYRVVLVEHVPRGCPCCRHMAVVRMAARAADAAAAAGRDSTSGKEKAAAAAAKISELAASAKTTVTTMYQGWKAKRAEKAAAEKAEKAAAAAAAATAEGTGGEAAAAGTGVGAAAAVAAGEASSVPGSGASGEPTFSDRAAKAKAAAARLFRSALAPPPTPAPASASDVPVATMSSFLAEPATSGAPSGEAAAAASAESGEGTRARSESSSSSSASVSGSGSASTSAVDATTAGAPAPAPAPMGWGAIARRKLVAALAAPDEVPSGPPAPAPVPAPAPAPAPGKSLSSVFGGFKSKVAALTSSTNTPAPAPAAAPAAPAPVPAPAPAPRPPAAGFTVGAALSAVAARDRTRSGSSSLGSLGSFFASAPPGTAAPPSAPPSAPSSRPTSIALTGGKAATGAVLADGPRDPAEAVRALALAGLGKGSTIVLDDWMGVAKVYTARKEKELPPPRTAAGGSKDKEAEAGQDVAATAAATPAKPAPESVPFNSPPPSAFTVGGEEDEEEAEGAPAADAAALEKPAQAVVAAAEAAPSSAEEVEAAGHDQTAPPAAVQLLPRLLCLVRDRLLVLEAGDSTTTSSGSATVKSNHHLTELGKLTFAKKAPNRLVLWYRRGPPPSAGPDAEPAERFVQRVYHVDAAAELREALQAAVAQFQM